MIDPKDPRIIAELAEFFLDGLKLDRLGTMDWIAQGDFDADEFVDAVKKIQAEAQGE